MSCRYSGFTPPKACFCWRTCKRRHLPRAFGTACGPIGPEGCSLTENTPFGGLSASLRCPNQLAAVGGILVFADRPLYSPNLNSLDFSTGSVLQPKGQATPHANFAALRPSVAAEKDRLVAVQIRKTCHSFRPHRYAVAKKNEVKIE